MTAYEMRISDWSSDVCSSDLTIAWVVARRTRTKHLIELGGLVPTAGLVPITDDDRAMLSGAFLDLAQRLSADDAEQANLLLRRRVARAFSYEAEAAAAARHAPTFSSFPALTTPSNTDVHS